MFSDGLVSPLVWVPHYNLYIIVCHESPDTRVCDGSWWGSLMVAAYAGPTFMILMTVAGIAGNKHASF